MRSSFTRDEFNFICVLVKSGSGIELFEDHDYLVESRLLPLVKKFGLQNMSELILKVKCEKHGSPVIQEVINAMTTNETLFFRDCHPFEYLKNRIIPNLMRARREQKKIRIWSAACSSGQEPYSIVIAYLENFLHCADWQLEVVATDINESILNKARAGIYSQFEVQRGLTETHLKKYFVPVNQGWKINDSVKKHVQFSKINLVDPNFNLGIFDIIFCRNILIYFNSETKKTVFQFLERSLVGDGYLALGGAESPSSFSDLWERSPDEEQPVFYRKKSLGLLKLGS